MEWVSNSLMKQLISIVPNCDSATKIHTSIGQLSKLFFPPIKRVHDCILISEKSIEELENSFNASLNMYLDKTGYEASISETCINDYFDEILPKEIGLQIAALVIKVWSLQLKGLDPNSIFCFIVCSNGERIEIRFHKVRNDESRWLSDDIECYKDAAVGYVCI